MFVTDSILSVLDKTLMIVFLSLLLWTSLFKVHFKIEWFIYSQTIAYIITGIVASTIVLRKCDYFLPRFNYKYIIIMLKKTIPFSVLTLLMFLYNRLEPILLERLLPDGKAQAGIYAQGYRIMDVLSNFILLFPVLLLPLFSKILKQRNDLGKLITLANSLMIVPAIVIASVCALYGNEIMGLLYHQPSSGKAFSTLIIGFIGISITYLYGTLLTANGNLKYLNIMALLAVVMNVSLNLILIPRYKASGAAYSSCITQSVAALVQIMLAYKIIDFAKNKTQTIRFFVWVIIFFLSAFLLKNMIVQWQTGFFAIAAVGIVFAFALKLVNVKEIIRTLLPAQPD